MVEVFILSLIQGVTEFLPVSSSSHLILISEFTNFQKHSLSIDVSLHIGSFIAVLTYFYRDILDFVKNKELLAKIIFSSIPVMLAGYFLIQTNLISELRSIKIIGWMTIIFGILLYISDKFKLDKNIDNSFNYRSALIIGLFQIMSLIPGVSRSGITITAARLLNFKRYDAAKISFLLSMPTLGAVSVFGLKEIIQSNNLSFSILNLFSILFSFFFSLITIKFFLKYIERFSLNLFVAYRVTLGLFILVLSTL